jgi:hypothetical protein
MDPGELLWIQGSYYGSWGVTMDPGASYLNRGYHIGPGLGNANRGYYTLQ